MNTEMRQTDCLKQKIIDTTVGMEQKLETIKMSFDSVLDGEFSVIVISDAAGTGKSTLALNAAKALSVSNTTFITGKFEQNGGKPYCALINLIDGVIRHLLTYSDAELKKIKKQLTEAIGTDSGFITAVNPYAKKIFGETKNIDISNYTKLKYRFNRTISKFILEISEILYPLVIFVDDIQWADTASIDILHYIYEKQSQPNLFLMMASRNNTDFYHQRIKKFILLHDIKHIQMGHLSIEAITQLIDKIFNGQINELNTVSKMIFKLTMGNPFYIKQLLNLIVDEHLIQFNETTDKWEMANDTMNTLDMPNGVKQIIHSRINNLTDDLKHTLQICSCIDGKLDKKILYNFKNLGRKAIDEQMDELCNKGFIIKEKNGTYGFVHDIVHQTIYETISQEEREQIHYQLGLAALKIKDDDYLIVAAMQLIKYNRTDPSFFNEPMAMALYNAGIKTIQSAAMEQALKIFTFCDHILPENAWDNFYDLTLKIKLEVVQCIFICGDYKLGANYLEQLTVKAKTKKDIANIQYKSLLLYMYIGDYNKVIDLGLKALDNLNYHISTDHIIFRILSKTAENVFLHFTNRFMTKSNHRWYFKDEEQFELILSVFTRLMFVAYFEDNKLLTYVLCNLMNISLRSNITDYIPISDLAYCFYCIMIINKPQRTKKLVNHKILKMLDKTENLTINCGMYFILGSFIVHLTLPLKYSLKYLEKSFEYGTQSIEYLYSGYVATMLRQTKYIMGEKLENIKKNDYIEEKYGGKTTDETLKWATYIFKHHILYLQDQNMKYDVSGQEDYIDQLDNGTKMTYYYYKLQRLYINNDIEQAYELINQTLPITNRLRGYLIYSDLIFFITLTRMDEHQHLSYLDKIRNKKFIDRYMKQFEVWAKLTDNHKTRQMILKVKYAVLFKKQSDFIEQLSEAITHAQNHGELQLEALCNLLICRYFKHNLTVVKHYAIEAKNLYLEWGAYRIAKLLSDQYSLEENGINASHDVKKQMSELEEKYIQEDTSIYINKIEHMSKEEMFIYTLGLFVEKTNAKYGAIFIENNGRIELQYQSNKEKNIEQCTKPLDFEKISILPKRVIRYVSRLQEDIIISSKAQVGLFEKDLYIKSQDDIAILCIPLKYSNIFVGILYLEWEHQKIFQDDLLKRIKSIGLSLIVKGISDDNSKMSKIKEELEPLTKRELEILECISTGMTNKKISEKLFISYSTTTTHIENLYRKLKVSNRIKAVIVATEAGILK